MYDIVLVRRGVVKEAVVEREPDPSALVHTYPLTHTLAVNVVEVLLQIVTSDTVGVPIAAAETPILKLHETELNVTCKL